MDWQRLFKFRSGPPRVSEPQPRPPATLHIESQYEWGERSNWSLNDRYCTLAIITISDAEGVPSAAIATSLVERNDVTFVVINSFTGAANMKSWESYLGTNAVRTNEPLAHWAVFNSKAAPIWVKISTGWLPREGIVVLDLMEESSPDASGARGFWIGLTIRDLNGEGYFEYYGQGDCEDRRFR